MSDGIKRRGFMASLGAFFGIAPLVEAGDVGDAELDAQVGDKPKPDAPSSQLVTGCSPGSIIELECNGIRCRAMVQDVTFDLLKEQVDVTSLFDRTYRYVENLKEVEITLVLRAIGETTFCPFDE